MGSSHWWRLQAGRWCPRVQSCAEVGPWCSPWLWGPGPFPDPRLDVDSFRQDLCIPSAEGALTRSSVSGFIYFRASRRRAHWWDGYFGACWRLAAAPDPRGGGDGRGDILGLGSSPRGSVFSWFPAPLVSPLPTPVIFQARSKGSLSCPFSSFFSHCFSFFLFFCL